jgi:hypothetical protein
MDLATEGRFSGVIFQEGPAEKNYNAQLPRVPKANGKTKLTGGKLLARQMCSVKRAANVSDLYHSEFTGPQKGALVSQ